MENENSISLLVGQYLGGGGHFSIYQSFHLTPLSKIVIHQFPYF